MLGSSVEPDLLETMKSVCAEIDGGFERLDLRRVGGVEDVELGEARDLPERRLHHLGAEARAPHAEQRQVREAAAPGGVGDLRGSAGRAPAGRW